MQMFVAAGWRAGMKNGGGMRQPRSQGLVPILSDREKTLGTRLGMRDLKRLFWTLLLVWCVLDISAFPCLAK